MTSLASKAMPIVLRLRGTKKKYGTAQNTRDEVADLLVRPKSFNPPSALDRKVDLSVRYVGGWRVYEVTPKGSTPARRGLYLHGGAYIHEIISGMWSLVAKTAVATSTRFTVPIYPLAPLGVAEHVVPAATDLAAEIIAEVGADRTALLGDSAGGGMTLAVALQLRDRDLAAPYRTVLISPWLDVSLAAPDISALAAKDHELAPPGLVAAGELYRGELPAEDPRVSPINGDFRASDRSPCSAALTTSSTQTPSVSCRWRERRACRSTTTKRPACSTSTPCSRSRRPSGRVKQSRMRSQHDDVLAGHRPSPLWRSRQHGARLSWSRAS